MLLYLLILIFFVVLGILVGYKLDKMLESIFSGIIIGLAVGYITILIIRDNVKTIEVQNPYCYLYNLQDESQVNGKFTLGTGRIQEKQYFVFYIKDKYGFKFSKLDASYCRIQETDGKPHLVRVKRILEKPNFLLNNIVLPQEVEWVFKVPKNTVIREFKLDLQ